MSEWNVLDYNIKNIEVSHLGENIFQNTDLIENILILKRRNSKQLKFSLLVPTSTTLDIFNEHS